jgi:hypothetical protein
VYDQVGVVGAAEGVGAPPQLPSLLLLLLLLPWLLLLRTHWPQVAWDQLLLLLLLPSLAC